MAGIRRWDKRRVEGGVGVEGTRGEGGLQGHYKPQRHGKPSCITKNQKKTTPLGKNIDVCQKLS